MADGWQAYEERLVFLQEHNYKQIVVWTKLHMLHYMYKFYEKIEQEKEAEPLLSTRKKCFAVLYKELLKAGKLPEEGKNYINILQSTLNYTIIKR